MRVGLSLRIASASAMLLVAALYACAPPPPVDAPVQPAVDVAQAGVDVGLTDAARVDASRLDASGSRDAADTPDAETNVVLGEGTCQSAEDCVVGDTSERCGSHSCGMVARSREAQAQFDRKLARRCGGTPRDRIPCPAAMSNTVVCAHHRCALIPEF